MKCHYKNKRNNFFFSNITHTEVEKELKMLFITTLNQEFNKSLEVGEFPCEMKPADVTPVIWRIESTKKTKS